MTITKPNEAKMGGNTNSHHDVKEERLQIQSPLMRFIKRNSSRKNKKHPNRVRQVSEDTLQSMTSATSTTTTTTSLWDAAVEEKPFRFAKDTNTTPLVGSSLSGNIPIKSCLRHGSSSSSKKQGMVQFDTVTVYHHYYTLLQLPQEEDQVKDIYDDNDDDNKAKSNGSGSRRGGFLEALLPKKNITSPKTNSNNKKKLRQTAPTADFLLEDDSNDSSFLASLDGPPLLALGEYAKTEIFLSIDEFEQASIINLGRVGRPPYSTKRLAPHTRERIAIASGVSRQVIARHIQVYREQEAQAQAQSEEATLEQTRQLLAIDKYSSKGKRKSLLSGTTRKTTSLTQGRKKSMTRGRR